MLNLQEALHKLREEFEADEYFEKEAFKSKVRDWLLSEHPHEYQWDKVDKNLTWKDVIDLIKKQDGSFDKSLSLDTEPREEIWLKACELAYEYNEELLDADFKGAFRQGHTKFNTEEEREYRDAHWDEIKNDKDFKCQTYIDWETRHKDDIKESIENKTYVIHYEYREPDSDEIKWDVSAQYSDLEQAKKDAIYWYNNKDCFGFEIYDNNDNIAFTDGDYEIASNTCYVDFETDTGLEPEEEWNKSLGINIKFNKLSEPENQSSLFKVRAIGSREDLIKFINAYNAECDEVPDYLEKINLDNIKLVEAVDLKTYASVDKQNELTSKLGSYESGRKQLVKEFNEEADTYPYWVIKTRDWYDPEGLDIPNDHYTIVFAGTEDECKNKIKEIIQEVNNAKDELGEIEKQGENFVTIYYEHAITRATYSVIKNIKTESNEKTKSYYIFIYDNEPAADRRPTSPEDIVNGITREELECKESELYTKVFFNYINTDDDIGDWFDEDKTPEEIESYCKASIEEADWGDGSPFCYAIYDRTDSKWIYGNKNSTKEIATEYINEDDIKDACEEKGINYTEFIKMI